MFANFEQNLFLLFLIHFFSLKCVNTMDKIEQSKFMITNLIIIHLYFT